MITRQQDEKYNVKAWYYPPIFPDVTIAEPDDLDWDVPQIIWGKFIKKTTTGLEIVPGMVATSKGEIFETNSTIDFNDKGKIGFGRVEHGKDNASKIQTDGIEDIYNNDANTVGNRFKTNQFVVKRITLG